MFWLVYSSILYSAYGTYVLMALALLMRCPGSRYVLIILKDEL